MGFLLKFILISFLLSWLLRVVIAYFARNLSNNSGGRRQNYDKSGTRRREGEMHISKQPGGQDKKIRKDVGEYVDYEEVK